MDHFNQLNPGDICCGFKLIKKEYVAAHAVNLYTMKHEKTGAELLYFDREDENKTFAIAFKTLPQDDTGVFHILEHSVLNGSEKYPVKEPFVSLLQNSMQTFLNAMTFEDKTLYPVSSRNEQDLFNLMSVYLDGVFAPLIYERPEIFMQEGWHYEFAEGGDMPYYNGVVFSEMKGAYADVEQLLDEEAKCQLFPDTSYGFASGGNPAYITDLSYEQFIETHKRFYHPSNAKIILDGHMEVERFLAYINDEYLSKYDYKAPDFDFERQTPVTAEKTVYFEVQEGEEAHAHMSVSKIFGMYSDTEKIYAAKILADYLSASNEAPLKRACLEQALAQDVNVEIHDQVYQPSVSVVFYNTDEAMFESIKQCLPKLCADLTANGLDKDALMASIERFAFENREISEPYGVELATRALGSWLYGGDPLTDIDNGKIFEALRAKVDTDYFENLLIELFGDSTDKSYVYALPSATKGEEDAKAEAKKIKDITDGWDDAKYQTEYERFMKMQAWQQSMDSEEAMASLPHLELSDVPQEMKTVATTASELEDVKFLAVDTETNGIAYMNLYFDVSDFTLEELQLVNVITACFGELATAHFTGEKLQTKIKSVFGHLMARVETMAKPGDLKNSRQYLTVSAGVLEENIPEAMTLLKEILVYGRYDDADKINETILQNDYFIKQAMIGNGHQFALTKVLSAFSQEGAIKEVLEGETFVQWFSEFAQNYMSDSEGYNAQFDHLMTKAFATNRLTIGYSGHVSKEAFSLLLEALPKNEYGAALVAPEFDKKACAIEIPGGVGFSAFGHNLYALGSRFSGSWAVLSSLMSFGYLWNMIRVQGGAYGTGMGVQMNGQIFVYSYRDPNLANTQAVYAGMADFLAEFVEQGMPLDEIIIGTLNMIEPLLSPAGICDQECVRYLKGITNEDIARIRSEILATDCESLKPLVKVMRDYVAEGKFCAVGDKHTDIDERFEFRTVRKEDAEDVVMIEQVCFPPHEACSRQHMLERVEQAPELFLVAVDKATGAIAGSLNGLATDEEKFRDEFFTDITLNNPNGKNVMLLGLSVLPEYRRQGLATALMHEYARREQLNGRSALILTCLKEKVEMYEKMGLIDLGLANSHWGGEAWHEMSLNI